MKKRMLLMVLLCNISFLTIAQNPAYPTPLPLGNIVQAEYFIDNFAAIGSGTPILLTPFTGFNNLSLNINTSTLQGGYHRLYIRTKDEFGKWSITNTKQFYVDQNPLYPNSSTLLNIVQAEYFIDNFVAIGSGTPILLTPFTDLNNLNVSMNTSTLQGGYHRLYIRTKDANGKWSITNTKRFYVDQDPPYPSSAPSPLITAAEYFIDQFVPIGSGIAIPVPSVDDFDSLSITLATQGLCHGTHRLYIRTKDANGKWSMTNSKEFEVTGDESIVQYQYYFDTDPGHGIAGNGLVQTISPTTTFTQNMNVNIPASLNEGFHTFFTRVKNDHCIWSIAERSTFMVQTITPVTPIVKYQYYFDTDPGLGIAGNGSVQNVSVDSTISLNLNINIPSGLSEGFHTLFTRVQHSAGVWSIAERSSFYISANNSSQIVTALEYFFDNDPGIGNGTPYAITPDSFINISATIPTTGLSAGIHYLYVRAKDENNRWSIIERDTLNIINNIGAPATCLRFDGVNDYVSLLSSSNTHVENNATIEMWVKWNGTNQDIGYNQMYGAVMGQQLNGVFSGCILGLDGPNPNTAKIIWRGSSGNVTDITSSISPGNGWNHIAITTSINSNSTKMYVNGILQGTSSGSTTLFISNLAPITLGAWIGDGDSYANADIDEVRIWKVERSQTEISNNMNCEYNNGPSFFFPEMLALYHLNQGIAGGDNLSIPVNSLQNEISNILNFGASTLNNFALTGSSSNWVTPSPIATGISCNNLNIKLFIQGYFNGPQLMAPVLFNQGYSMNLDETDSIEVELRDPITLLTIASTKALLKSNGFANCKFPPLTGSYYIMIKHRNAIQTWSASPVTLMSGLASRADYNFTVSAGMAYGSNQVEVAPSRWALYSGDINQDENIDLGDFSLLELDINNFEFGYKATDINGDGSVDLQDVPLVELNSSQFIYSNHP